MAGGVGRLQLSRYIGLVAVVYVRWVVEVDQLQSPRSRDAGEVDRAADAVMARAAQTTESAGRFDFRMHEHPNSLRARTQRNILLLSCFAQRRHAVFSKFGFMTVLAVLCAGRSIFPMVGGTPRPCSRRLGLVRTRKPRPP